MEDGNNVSSKEEKYGPLTKLYKDLPLRITSNGHDSSSDAISPHDVDVKGNFELAQEDNHRKRINPLKIHLGKRPFVDNSTQPHTPVKRKNIFANRLSDHPKPPVPRIVPKLIPKKVNRNQFQNVALHSSNKFDPEEGKPVPRLVPKSQLPQFKKGKTEKSPQFKEYTQYLGLQPMKFECQKCCVIFRTLLLLKEHQQICSTMTKEPTPTPAPAPSIEANNGGPSRTAKKVYLCRPCGTYYENWNLFLHMREVHNRHICLFCLGMFSKAEKLSLHLINKHSVTDYKFDSKEEFFDMGFGKFYLMCCNCEEVYSEQDEFFSHDCNNVKPKPVPVLISKTGPKANTNVKQLNKNNNEVTINGPLHHKDPAQSSTEIAKCDNKNEKEVKSDVVPPITLKLGTLMKVIENTNITNDLHIDTDKDCNINSKLPHINVKTNNGIPMHHPSSASQNKMCSKQQKDSSINDFKISTPECDSNPILMDINQHANKVHKIEETVEKEKDCGIKLKLSLNNAKSPVIINSTVDPTVGKQNAIKPPPRIRRPPKRYEKDIPTEPPPPLSTPTIKMTICDNADSPFVKSTIIENKQEKTTRVIMNNNFETMQEPCGKQDNILKSTIYNNSPDEGNSLNRVPKLTVRVPTTQASCGKPDNVMKSTTYDNNPDEGNSLNRVPKLTVRVPTTQASCGKPDNVIKSTIYDNNPDEGNSLNRVPKLTVRVPKELLDKDSSSADSSDSEVDDRLTVDEKEVEDEQIENKMEVEEEPRISNNSLSMEVPKEENEPPQIEEKKDENADEVTKTAEIKEENTTAENAIESSTVVKPDKVDEIPVTELTLDRPLDKYPLKDLLKVFLSSTVFNCIYCNHVRKIAVNCEQLALHMVAQHQFAATVDSITAEELLPETITSKVKSGAVELQAVYINLDSYDSVDKCDKVPYDQVYECFQCYFKTNIHKDLYLHNRKMHQKTILLCVMCKTNFYSYSELLCHLCPGTYDSENQIRFRCCLCNIDSIPSSFRLMVHLRKIHHTCDVCLEFCFNQSRLSNHVWKHKLHHVCYRCGIAYRNKPDITKHLFWKHGTESVMCKKCLQKKWPHVYHFCIPPAMFICEECSLAFTKAVYLKVHKRFHAEEFPHICQEEDCTEKFVSKKLLMKHIETHKQSSILENESKEENITIDESLKEDFKDVIPVIDLVDEKPSEEKVETASAEKESEPISKKAKKRKLKDKDILLGVNLPALNLSESDSSDESDSGQPSQAKVEEQEAKLELESTPVLVEKDQVPKDVDADVDMPSMEVKEKAEPSVSEVSDEQQVLDIWDNFKKYQAKVEKQKTPPLVPIRKHVCESDHDYCLIPTDLNGEDGMKSPSKKLKKKSQKRKLDGASSSSSSSSDSDSSCSCGSNCSCSSSSGSSSSSSSDSDSSDSGRDTKKKKQNKKTLPNRRTSCGSQMSAVDVMGMTETPILIPEKLEPPIAESDLETEESETDEEFYDEYPQRLANKLMEEKRNQLLLLASVAPSDNGSISGEVSRSITPVKEEPVVKEKLSSNKKKAKKKKRSKASKKTANKLNIPKEIIPKSANEVAPCPLVPNKMTISLQSNKVQLPGTPVQVVPNSSTHMQSSGNKRSSKRRRVPNKFYGYSSDEDSPTPQQLALKPQLPPKLEWRKEDLPSPVTHKAKKEVPSTTLTQKLFSYTEPIRLIAPIPDPEPPRILMNTESLESSDTDSSNEGALEIYQPNLSSNPIPVPPPHLNSGTSSLPYAFVRPPVRQAREGESVYCYCRCPYDEVSEMIACDAEGCTIEWFHFECVGIMVPPKGKWYCPECRKKQNYSGFR